MAHQNERGNSMLTPQIEETLVGPVGQDTIDMATTWSENNNIVNQSSVNKTNDSENVIISNIAIHNEGKIDEMDKEINSLKSEFFIMGEVLKEERATNLRIQRAVLALYGEGLYNKQLYDIKHAYDLNEQENIIIKKRNKSWGTYTGS